MRTGRAKSGMRQGRTRVTNRVSITPPNEGDPIQEIGQEVAVVGLGASGQEGESHSGQGLPFRVGSAAIEARVTIRHTLLHSVL